MLKYTLIFDATNTLRDVNRILKQVCSKESKLNNWIKQYLHCFGRKLFYTLYIICKIPIVQVSLIQRSILLIVFCFLLITCDSS